MCEFYAKADPILYESRTRSVRIDGVVTSIRLENFVWEILARIAEDEASSTNALISTLHREVMQANGETPNFASFLRVTCLRYLNRKLQGGAAESEDTDTSQDDFRASERHPFRGGVTRQ
ncbi:MAG: ribbon-helix-helix domain-containing protein [Burkholderiaceae bacterium]|jgi:predicted DNA-binding ribbon-helix-helix protein